jgi:hypothetical protein
MIIVAMDSSDVLNEMDILLEKYLRLRAYFPYMPKSMIGKTEFHTAPIYSKALNLDIAFVLDRPLTENDIENNNQIAGFTNQNFIIRLCSLLEVHHVLKYATEVDRTIAGCEDAHLVRQLRNRFAHSSGKPDLSDKDDRKLFDRLNGHLKLNPPEYIENAKDFPLNIDTVIRPLFLGCKMYAMGALRKEEKLGVRRRWH